VNSPDFDTIDQDVRFCPAADGVRIAYATIGEGPPLVKAANWLNHLEFDAQSPVWRHWLRDLSRDHQLVRYDERGCGLSDWDVRFSFDAWVADLETVVDTLGLERFPLLGISQGGSVAITYAVRHPERVSHLILYGAYGQGWAHRGLSGESLAEYEAHLTLMGQGWGRDNPAYRQLFTSLFMPGATPDQAQWFNELQRVSTSPENAVRFLREFGKIDVIDLLPRVSVPALVLHARGDARVPFEMGRELATGIPDCRFVSLDSPNHLILEHEPAWATFLNEVRRFLGVETTDDRRSAGTAAAPAAAVSGVSSDHTPAAFEPSTVEPSAGKPPAVTPGTFESPTGEPGPFEAVSDRYAIERELARGGMATVYLARDLRHEREVVIKVFDPDLSSEVGPQRFEQEIRVTSGLQHPHILPLLDSGSIGDSLFYVMPFVAGASLRHRLRQAAPLPVTEALGIARDVAAALDYAHRNGVIHRDIKPENILLSDGHAIVADFGIAHVASGATNRLTDTGAVIGTLSYISPEQLGSDAEVGPPSDVYSLACVVYEMLCGEPPFRGLPQQVIQGHLSGTPRALQDHVRELPEPVDTCVRRSLAKSQADRHGSATALVQELFTCFGASGTLPPATEGATQDDGASMERGRGRGWWPFRS
jgi:pimeloyl-ACP methyl ester carboxylesterase/tRNA A-37 threonylcarbamoyl transferase component Bud32